MRKSRFGSKSERTRNLLEEDGQLNLFNEIELEGDPEKKEKDPIQLSRNKVKVRQPKTKREVVTHGLPEEEVILDIPEKEANCVQCGTKLKAIGKKVVRETLQYIPASLKIIRYVQVSYECPRCKRQPEDNPVCAGQLRMSPLQTYGQSVHRSPESTGSGAEPFACFPFHRGRYNCRQIQRRLTVIPAGDHLA